MGPKPCHRPWTEGGRKVRRKAVSSRLELSVISLSVGGRVPGDANTMAVVDWCAPIADACAATPIEMRPSSGMFVLVESEVECIHAYPCAMIHQPVVCCWIDGSSARRRLRVQLVKKLEMQLSRLGKLAQGGSFEQRRCGGVDPTLWRSHRG